MRKGAAIALVLLGVAQMAGDLLRLPALRGIAAATAASPVPKVFSAVRGLETFSSRFTLEIREAGAGVRRVVITPEMNGRLRGPYNRRNLYGAVLAYGPILASDPRTRPMFDAVTRASLCGASPLLAEMGLLAGTPAGIEVEVTPREGVPPPDLPLRWAVDCR